ncbi:MAG: alpha-amylase family protein [Breznakibacter sp.]
MEKAVVYQLLVRLFGNPPKANVVNGSIEQNGCGKLNQISSKALDELRKMGITHVWYTGVAEHAKTTGYQTYGIGPYPPHLVKGKAGSPYAIVDYYDVDPDLAEDVPNRIAEFGQLIARTHEAGLKAIIDFVPNHVARAYKSDAKPAGIEDFGACDDVSLPFSPHNNFYYLPGTVFQPPVTAGNDGDIYTESPAKVTGNDCLTASPSVYDWYETVKLNYGIDLFGQRAPHFNPVPDTWQKMLHILLYWAGKGVDGFRCDMAEMVPVAFWHYAIREVKARYPHIVFVAEVYTPSLYHDYISVGGFDWLYDKVGMYDTIRAVVQRQKPAHAISSAWEAVSSISGHMLFFLENHDEQRIASPFFAGDGEQGWPGFFVSATLNSNPLMVYFGQEVGVDGMDQEGFSGLDGRTSIFDYWSVVPFQRWVNQGRFDGAGLTFEQAALRDKYVALLGLLHREKAFMCGNLYDLAYANTSNPRFDTAALSAYLRYTPNEVLLCVANFGGDRADARVVIPGHAFGFCGLSDRAFFKSEDLLLSGTSMQCPVAVAQTGGMGVLLKPFQTLVFRLK